jgi:hypothetical protein
MSNLLSDATFSEAPRVNVILANLVQCVYSFGRAAIKMRKNLKSFSIQILIFFLLLAGLEIFCAYQINQNRLFHFNAQVDASFYPVQNTREMSPDPSSIKYGVFPLAPKIETSQNLEPIHFRFTEKPLVNKKSSYSKTADLPFFIQTESEKFQRFDKNDKLVYEAMYNIDDKYRRVTTSKEKSNNEKNFLIMAGCSYTFGSGLNDEQTLASIVNLKSKKFEAYNYGMRGASPGDILLRLNSIKPQDLPQKTGAVIYIYIDDHMARLTYDPNIIGTWGAKSGYYKYDDGPVEYLGTYEETFPIKTLFYKLLFSTNTVRYFFMATFNSVKIQDFDKLTTAIEQMQKVSFEKLHAENFYVLIYPATYSARILAQRLEMKKIKYLDYSNWNMFLLSSGQSVIQYDGHPSYESNLILGQSISETLDKQ